MAATEVQDASLPGEYKEWVLKVSIDCAGCGKKVRKALLGIEGVHGVEIDLKQQKVTVIGKVDAGTLIRRLMKKTKKAAELCPDESPAAKNESEKGDVKANRDADGGDKNRDPQTETKSEDPSSSTCGGAPEKDGDDPPSKKKGGGAPAKDTSGDAPSKDGDGESVEKKSDCGLPEKKSDLNSGDSSLSQSPEIKNEGTSPAGGNGGKKKKRKGKKHNVDVADGSSPPTPTPVGEPAAAVAANGSSPSPPTSAVNGPSDTSPPRQRAYQHAPPVLSYNMARPTGFSSASYYSPPAARSSYSYSYDVPGVETGPPPSYYSSYPPPSLYQDPSRPPEFEFFSEENPNACRVM